MATPTLDELEHGLELVSHVRGKPIPTIDYGVDPDHIGEPKEGVKESECRVCFLEFLAKFPPAEVARFLELLDETGGKVRQARFRLRKKFLELAKHYGFHHVRDVL